MTYKFPLIHNIRDVLPAIEGLPEFSVNERPFGTVIGYHVQLESTFPALTVDGAAIRRECRGLVFDKDTGKITSRPLHKFFNLNERDETQQHLFDFSHAQLLAKLDGSMIRNIRIGDSYRLGTKAGITDIAMAAERFVARRPEYHDFIQNETAHGYTTIFEFTGPKNRIVVDYPEEQLTLLAIRENVTGAYVHRGLLELQARNFGIPLVASFDFQGFSNNRLIEEIRGRKDEEGYVVVMPDETRLKIKNDWYVRLHQAKDEIGREKNVVRHLINETIDDVKPALSPEDLRKVNKFEAEFWQGLLRTAQDIVNHHQKLLSMFEGTLDERQNRKLFAEHLMMLAGGRDSGKKFTKYTPFLYKLYANRNRDHKDFVFGLLKEHVLKSCSSQTTIDACRSLWDGARYEYGNMDE